jgi:hypothetical protein
MKNFILIIIIAGGLISCKKDRTCTCKYSDGSTASEATYTKVTKKEAKNLCVTTASGITCTVN